MKVELIKHYYSKAIFTGVITTELLLLEHREKRGYKASKPLQQRFTARDESWSLQQCRRGSGAFPRAQQGAEEVSGGWRVGRML